MAIGFDLRRKPNDVSNSPVPCVLLVLLDFSKTLIVVQYAHRNLVHAVEAMVPLGLIAPPTVQRSVCLARKVTSLSHHQAPVHNAKQESARPPVMHSLMVRVCRMSALAATARQQVEASAPHMTPTSAPAAAMVTILMPTQPAASSRHAHAPTAMPPLE